MPTKMITLPNNEIVPVYSATNGNGYARIYFNGKRMGYVGDNNAFLYRKLIPKLQTTLVSEIAQSGIAFDAVVSPPSTGTDIEPYRDAILERWDVPDLSNNFKRHGLKKAAHQDTTLQDMIGEYIYTRDGTEPSIQSVLIIDETIASGKSVAAVIHHLRQAGMPLGAKIYVAVCCDMS